MEEVKKWYDKKWMVVVLILFLFPVGLFGFFKGSAFGKTSKVILAALIGLIILIGVFAPADNNSVKKEKVVAVYDVPALLGKNIKEVKQILGTPINASEKITKEMKKGKQSVIAVYKKDSVELWVAYNMKTGKVENFFVPANNESGSVENIDTLLEKVNASYSTDYEIEASGVEGAYVGVKIFKLSAEEKQRAALLEKVKEQFSSWDGAHKNLEKAIKKNMNDPSSYEHVETTYSVYRTI